MIDFEKIQSRVGPLLLPPAFAYRMATDIRAAAYTRQLLKSWTPSAPCISVGNISWGGSGKTPIISWLLDRFQEKGSSCAVLTRGYKAAPPTRPYLVTADSPPDQAGDEPLLLARQHPKAHIVVDPERTRGGQWAEDQVQPDLFLLDDGFQHLRVKRSLDLVCFSPSDILHNWNRVIPAGTWREGKSALKRAHAFLVNTTGANLQTIQTTVLDRLAPFDKPVFFFEISPTRVLKVVSGEEVTDLNGISFLLVTGIANPKRVVRSATAALGYPPADHVIFPDHHSYTDKDIRKIEDVSRQIGAPFILTTPKDAVKLQQWKDLPLLTLELELRFLPSGEVDFAEWIDAAISL